MRGVRVDRRHADRREVVREVAPRVELAVLGAVAAALLVGGAPGEVTEEAGPAGGYAPEALYQEQRDLVVLVAQRVVVVAQYTLLCITTTRLDVPSAQWELAVRSEAAVLNRIMYLILFLLER